MRRPINRLPVKRLVSTGFVSGNGWIFSGQLVEIADFDVFCRHHARPLGARAQEPLTAPDQSCSMERISGDQQLHTVPTAQVWSDDDPFGGAVGVQQEYLERISEVLVVELVVADSVKPYRGVGRHHEVERGTQRSPLRKRCWQPARRDRVLARAAISMQIATLRRTSGRRACRPCPSVTILWTWSAERQDRSSDSTACIRR